MPRLKLTANGIKNLKAKANGKCETYRDTRTVGLLVEAYTSGVKTFVAWGWIRGAGRAFRLSLGRYQDRVFGLVDARLAAEEALRAAAVGVDPTVERRIRKRAQAVERRERKQEREEKEKEEVMSRVTLYPQTLKTLPPGDDGKRVPYYDTEVQGLTLRVGNTRVFYFEYSFRGKSQRIRLGDLNSDTTLAQYRKKARRLRSRLDLGVDPKAKEQEVGETDLYASAERLEKSILARGAVPGVYFRQDPSNLCIFYIGKSDNIAKRNQGHNNSPLRLTRAWVTKTKEVAEELENCIHNYLIQGGAIPLKGRGLYQFKNDRPLIYLDVLIDTTYSHLCQSMLGFEGV